MSLTPEMAQQKLGMKPKKILFPHPPAKAGSVDAQNDPRVARDWAGKKVESPADSPAKFGHQHARAGRGKKDPLTGEKYPQTALDRYIAKADGAYHWELNSTFRSDVFGYTAYNLLLTSQHWLTPQASTGYVWKHWLTVCVPDIGASSDQAFLWVDGGDKGQKAPDGFIFGGANQPTEAVCVGNHAVSGLLKDIPNEPLWFTDDWKHKRRTEDEIIAYTWSHFINNTAEPDWLLRLPMVKATVKAMDAMQEFTQTLTRELPDGPPKRFVIAGASKRGWVTWLMGAVDARVYGIVPMVMPILNIQPNINSQVRAYGDWSFALDDYLNENLMFYLNQPVFDALAAVVDPYTYRLRMTMPKLVLSACGDEFFLPDSPRFFIDGLVGEWWLTVIPDAEHSLGTAWLDVAENLISFYHMMLHPEIPRPKMEWEMHYSNTTGKTTLQVDNSIGYGPTAVTQYSAYTLSTTKRDFRLIVCSQLPECLNPVIWWPTLLSGKIVNGSSNLIQYEGSMGVPQRGGWAGFVLTAEFQLPGLADHIMHLSTQVNIVPDCFPYPPCYEQSNECCQNPSKCETQYKACPRVS